MTPTRWFLAALWIFIGIALVWQFNTYNRSIDQAGPAHHGPQHFFYFTGSAPAPPPKPPADGPDVRQIGFTLEEKSVSSSNLTLDVALKNFGNAKAVNVRIFVRPFRGIKTGDEDAGGADMHLIPEESPLSQLGQWVEFPDLNPGDTSTRSVDFYRSTAAMPGSNPDPLIAFDKEKPKLPPPHPTSP